MPEKVAWYHDQRLVPSSSQDMETVYSSRSGEAALVIPEVFPQDSGLYECVAANIHGKAVTKALLNVEGMFYTGNGFDITEKHLSLANILNNVFD